MIYKRWRKKFLKNFWRASKNWGSSRGGKFLPASRQQNYEVILRQSASGFCWKKVLTSSSRHHQSQLSPFDESIASRLRGKIHSDYFENTPQSYF